MKTIRLAEAPRAQATAAVTLSTATLALDEAEKFGGSNPDTLAVATIGLIAAAVRLAAVKAVDAPSAVALITCLAEAAAADLFRDRIGGTTNE